MQTSAKADNITRQQIILVQLELHEVAVNVTHYESKTHFTKLISSK